MKGSKLQRIAKQREVLSRRVHFLGRIVDSNIPRNSEKWTVAPYELCVISGECLRLARLTGETNLIAEAQRSIAAVKGATSENSRRNATEEELPIIDSQNIQDGLKDIASFEVNFEHSLFSNDVLRLFVGS